MNKVKSLFRWVILLSIVTVLLSYNVSAKAPQKMPENPETERADVIQIDALKVFGKLERHTVEFLHDKHTDALEKKNKGCSACHKSENYKLSPKFMRLSDEKKKTSEDIYHKECIGCHQKAIDKKEASGPVTCGECHKDTPTVGSLKVPISLNKSLHYRHSKAYENKCEKCHHEYDKQTKKLVYEKGKEGSCTYCHKKETEENRISIKLASHSACIDCHIQELERKKEAGPVKCNGCHHPKDQKKIKVVSDVPRMDRKQPDSVMIKTGDEKLDAPQANRMNLVPFDHMAHENYNDTCSACHHAEMDKCSKCHSLEGLPEGDNINLELAMHKDGAVQSCTGCHELKQKDKECAGCHSFIGKNKTKDLASCEKCHMKPLEITDETLKDDIIARNLLSTRSLEHKMYDIKDIPEKVTIKKLSNQYEPAEFPHRKIVLSIIDGIKDNKLANYFHEDKGTVCQGCHHNGPATATPTKCSSCHGKPFNNKDIHKPGLMGAYHRQCMECHKVMDIDKPKGCTECHKKK